MKTCRVCKKSLSDTMFGLKGTSKTIFSTACDTCRQKPALTWNKRNPDRMKKSAKRFIDSGGARQSRLIKKYKITNTEYNQIFNNQNMKCAICETKDAGGKYNVFSIDHDHKTGRVRGLLCCNCNRGIGYLKDDIKVIKNALKYLSTKIIVFIFSLIVTSAICYSMSNFITDKEFTNCVHSRREVYTFISKITHILTPDEISYALDMSDYYSVNPLVVFATMQKESSIVEGDESKRKNKYIAMGYHHMDSRTLGYSNQVRYGTYCLAMHFNDPIRTIPLYDREKRVVTPLNHAENALYIYTPRWKDEWDNGWSGGNYYFKCIYQRYTNQILKI